MASSFVDTTCGQTPRGLVAVVRQFADDGKRLGAGPGGLATARWLLSQGFEPTIFEQAPMLGGQWTGLAGVSGVWPTMHTNTSRVMTAFTDLEHETDLVYPSARDVLAYLHRYAETFDLVSRIRFGTRVDRVRRDGSGWLVGHTAAP